MTMIKNLILLIIFFQFYYTYKSIISNKIVNKKNKNNNNFRIEPITIIIPILNSEKTITKCLKSIFLNKKSLIKQIIIVFDHCNDQSEFIVNKIEKKYFDKKIKINYLHLNKNQSGKVAALLEAFKITKTEFSLLIDSDIVLTKNTIEKLVNFHYRNKNFYSSCYIYPYVNKKTTFLENIINNDRLYRQNILQNVREFYGLSNFPGGIGIVNTQEYKEKLKSGFLEDLTTTLVLIKFKKKISILREPLAFEMERKSIKGVILQRIRWTIGNIENVKNLFLTINCEKKIFKKVILISYPVMWYLQHYFIIIGNMLFCLSLTKKLNLIFLLPQLLYFIQVLISANIGKKYYKNNILGIILHSIIYPFIITTTLLISLFVLIKKRKMFFETKLLFTRI